MSENVNLSITMIGVQCNLTQQEIAEAIKGHIPYGLLVRIPCFHKGGLDLPPSMLV